MLTVRRPRAGGDGAAGRGRGGQVGQRPALHSELGLLLRGHGRGHHGGHPALVLLHGGGDGVWHDPGAAELGGDAAGKVSVLSLHVPAHGVVAGECPGTVGAGDPDALVALADVRAQVRLVAVGALAEGAFQLGAYRGN